jgi:adenine-specific DNA-methyltransferase
MGIATDLQGSIVGIFKKDEKQSFFSDDGNLLRNAVYEATMSMDKDLIKLLLSDKKIKETFFEDVDGILVFDKVKFGWTINNKEFLPDSYTRFKNKIGLIDENNQFISNSGNVVLSFPYKDCILEGGKQKKTKKEERYFITNCLLLMRLIGFLLQKFLLMQKNTQKMEKKKQLNFMTMITF